MSKGEMEVGVKRKEMYESGGKPFLLREFGLNICPHTFGLKPEA